MSNPQQKALGDFLRARREALDPRSLSLPVGRRRTPWLRREEVAQRADIGIDWYERLEQGRSVSPSETTVEALSRALCLGEAEHAHLWALARAPRRPSFVRETVPPTIQRLLDGLGQPA